MLPYMEVCRQHPLLVPSNNLRARKGSLLLTVAVNVLPAHFLVVNPSQVLLHEGRRLSAGLENDTRVPVHLVAASAAAALFAACTLRRLLR